MPEPIFKDILPKAIKMRHIKMTETHLYVGWNVTKWLPGEYDAYISFAVRSPQNAHAEMCARLLELVKADPDWQAFAEENPTAQERLAAAILEYYDMNTGHFDHYATEENPSTDQASQDPARRKPSSTTYEF